MANEDDLHSSPRTDLFREKVSAARRQTGHLQRELADALSIDAQVLSRKLHAAKRTFLTHAEVKLIVQTLAAWDAISTQAEAYELLSFMNLKRESFSDEEWHSPPLNRLESTPDMLASDATFPSSLAVIRPPLPASSTSLIGRDDDICLLHDLLQQNSVRLITLRGTGGVGKTRLALEVARVAQADFADGVFFVPLATLYDATLVPSTLVQSLHLSEPFAAQNPGEQNISTPEELLENFLHTKELLLVLDNVEQIPAIVPLISDLLHAAPRLKIMVTSRAVLQLYGEYDFEVLPLAVDTLNERAKGADISQLPAIRLFVERARAVNPTYQASTQDLNFIAQICARLDGLPLAIELAAVRTKMFSLPAILQRLLDERGRSLTFLRSTAHDIAQRHQTLYKTLDWSYELLDPEQQRLFLRLAVFVGSWTLQAAKAVALPEMETATQDDVADCVESLLNHSLVKQLSYTASSLAEDLERRFYLLETIREYGLARLEESGEHGILQRRHACYYLTLAEDIEPELSDRAQSRAVSLLAQEEGNLRAALEWSIADGETEIAQRLCGALGRYWEARTQFREAHRWIDAVLPMTQETPSAVRAKLIMAASRLALWEVAYERSRMLAQEALALYVAMNDVIGRAWAIFQIADTWHMQGEYSLATSYFEKSLPLLREQADWRGYAFTLSRLGAMAMLQGNFSQAFSWLNEALTLLREYSEPALLNVTLIYLGVLTFVQSDFLHSVAYLREGLLLAQETNNRYMLATDLLSFGCVLGVIRAPSYAARVCSAAETLFANLHTTLPMAYRPLYDSYISGLRSQVDDATWNTWWMEGSSLPQDEICSLVLTASENVTG